MRQKAAHQNILYGVYDEPCPSHQRQWRYFYRFDEAVKVAKNKVRNGLIGVVVRYTVEFKGMHKLGVLMMALEGAAFGFLGRKEHLEAWGFTPEGKLRRVNLRGARWKQWDGTVR
jgi:hypothetical protein